MSVPPVPTHDALHGQRVLVTGGCGFIGVNLVDELTQSGAEVTVVDLEAADWTRLPSTALRVVADINDAEALRGACDGIDIVYHLAARTDLDGKRLDDYTVNFVGARNVVDECVRSGSVRRFVFYSTQLVVGLFNEKRFIDETEPYRTKTVYGQSKIEGEKAVIASCSDAGLPYTIIRPTSVYGPWGEAPYKAFFGTIKAGRYRHVGRADNLVSWVYVKNLVELTSSLSLLPLAENEIYFGNDFHPYTMREIVDAVGDFYGVRVPTVPTAVMTAIAYAFGALKLLGVKVPIYPFRLRNIRASYCYDIGKSVSTGYFPRYGLSDGLRETLAWYESHPDF